MRCVWLKSGLNAFGVPRTVDCFLCPLVALHPRDNCSVFWREKTEFFSHCEITTRVDHFVNPFMAINLITRVELCSSKCEFRAKQKSCKNPLEVVVPSRQSKATSSYFIPIWSTWDFISDFSTVHYENTLQRSFFWEPAHCSFRARVEVLEMIYFRGTIIVGREEENLRFELTFSLVRVFASLTSGRRLQVLFHTKP